MIIVRAKLGRQLQNVVEIELGSRTVLNLTFAGSTEDFLKPWR